MPKSTLDPTTHRLLLVQSLRDPDGADLYHAPWSTRLARARRMSGMTQAELARRVGASEREVSRWEHGIVVARADVRRKLMAVLV